MVGSKVNSLPRLYVAEVNLLMLLLGRSLNLGFCHTHTAVSTEGTHLSIALAVIVQVFLACALFGIVA